jgi:hypothetical protein
MRAIISRVLDQILEGPSEQTQAQMQQATPGFDLPMMDNVFDFEAFGDFDFLGETDWMKVPWLGGA